MTLTDPGLTDEITALYLNRMVGKWILQGTSLAYYLNLVLISYQITLQPE